MEKTKVSINDLYPIIKAKLNEGGEVDFTVTGNSMLPFLKDGKTLVTIKKVEDKLKRGDIVFYYDKKQYVLHRILKVKKDFIITCGDGLNRLEHIYRKDIFAIVIKYQNGKKVTDVKSLYYRFKVRLWMLLRPIRRYLLYFVRRMQKIS